MQKDETIYAKLDGLTSLINERFGDNIREHESLLDQVSKTNGRVRLLERVIWGLGGAVTMIGLTAANPLVEALTKLL